MSQSSHDNRIQKGALAIDQQLYDFIENEVLPKVGVDSDSYWSGFEKVVKAFTPRNNRCPSTFQHSPAGFPSLRPKISITYYQKVMTL
jgi:malate synthase